MDTIIYVNGDQVIPYMVVKSQDWVCKTDLEIFGTTDNPSAKGLGMMKLIQHLGAQRRAYNLSLIHICMIFLWNNRLRVIRKLV